MPSVTATLPSWKVTAHREFLAGFLGGFKIDPKGSLRVPIQGEMGRLLSRRLDAASAPALAHVLKEAVQGVQALSGPEHDWGTDSWELDNAWGGLPVTFDIARRIKAKGVNRQVVFSASAPDESKSSSNLSKFHAHAKYNARGDLGLVHASLRQSTSSDQMGLWVEQERLVDFFDKPGHWDVNSYTTLVLSAYLGFFAEHLQKFGNDFDSLTPAQQALMYTVYIFADLSKRNELPLWLTLEEWSGHSNTTHTLKNARDPKQVRKALEAIAQADIMKFSMKDNEGLTANYCHVGFACWAGGFEAHVLNIMVRTLDGQGGRDWAGFHALFDSALQAISGGE